MNQQSEALTSGTSGMEASQTPSSSNDLDRDHRLNELERRFPDLSPLEDYELQLLRLEKQNRDRKKKGLKQVKAKGGRDMVRKGGIGKRRSKL